MDNKYYIKKRNLEVAYMAGRIAGLEEALEIQNEK